jgi:segregation and condensation protein B
MRIAGHREVPGRPLLYATSRRFLEVFGLARIEDLPTLRDLAELAPVSTAAGEPTRSSVESERAPEESALTDEEAAEDLGFEDEELDEDEPQGVSH